MNSSSLPLLGTVVALLGAALCPAEIPAKLLELGGTHYYSIFDGDQKAGWAKFEHERTKLDGEPVYHYLSRDETVGLYFGELQSMVWTQEEYYQANPPYHLLRHVDTVEERGFKKQVVITPDPAGGKGALQAEITEGNNVRQAKIQGDGKPLTLEDFFYLETVLINGPKIGKSYPNRTLNTEEFLIDEISMVVLESEGEDAYRVGLDAEPAGRYLTATIMLDGTWKRFGYSSGPRYEWAKDEEEAKADLGNYSFETMWEVPVDKPLGPPGTITELVVKVKGNWSETLENNGLQSFTYNFFTRRTTIKVGKRYRRAAPVTKEDREKALRATNSIPANDPKITKLARSATDGAKNDWEKVERLCAFVSRTLDYQIDLDPLSSMESLAQKRGDCSEHADLFAAMARSIGIPTRSTSGWVYLGDEELLFGYHAWNEVAIEGNWVSVDATWGELYPNATHIKMEIEEADHRFARKVDDGELVFKVVRVKSAPDVRLKASNEQIRKYPGEPAWLEARASLYMDLERYSEAIRDLNAAIKLAPDIAEYHEFLAMGYGELDEGAKAIAAQGQAAKLSPNHPGYWHDLAWLQMREGAYGDAIASVNKALELRPDNIEYLDSRAYFHYGRNDHKAALADIERAIAITASDPMLHTTRGMILLGAKSYGEAEKAFTQGIQLDPADPWLLIHRATARDHLKDPKGAREDLMKALMIKDLDADAISEIRDMLSVLRDSEPARP